MQEIRHSENPEQFMELPNSWEERGIRKGIEKGIEQGLEQGMEKAKKEMVLEMLKEDVSIDLISKVTHLDIETIEALKETN